MICRFVVVRHELPSEAPFSSHWDLMIERDGRLWTWRLSENCWEVDSQDAQKIADHRVEYLDFTGPLSGNRGTVHPYDRGEIHVQTWTDLQLRGVMHARTHTAELSLTANSTESDPNRWRLHLQKT